MKTNIYDVAVGDVIYYKCQNCFGEVLRFENKNKIIIDRSNEPGIGYGFLDCFATEDFTNNYLICENDKEKLELILRMKEF